MLIELFFIACVLELLPLEKQNKKKKKKKKKNFYDINYKAIDSKIINELYIGRIREHHEQLYVDAQKPSDIIV